jgi:hypothetical protein
MTSLIVCRASPLAPWRTGHVRRRRALERRAPSSRRHPQKINRAVAAIAPGPRLTTGRMLRGRTSQLDEQTACRNSERLEELLAFIKESHGPPREFPRPASGSLPTRIEERPLSSSTVRRPRTWRSAGERSARSGMRRGTDGCRKPRTAANRRSIGGIGSPARARRQGVSCRAPVLGSGVGSRDGRRPIGVIL